MKSTVICYKMKEPVVYNKGTKYETSRDTFLAYYTYKSVAEAQKEVDEINSTHPAEQWNKTKIDWDKVDYYFVSEQEEMY